MIRIRCKRCNQELQSSPQVKICGCENQTTLHEDTISAIDLSQVVIVENHNHVKSSNVLTSADIAWQEERRKRKVRKLDFEIR